MDSNEAHDDESRLLVEPAGIAPSTKGPPWQSRWLWQKTLIAASIKASPSFRPKHVTLLRPRHGYLDNAVDDPLGAFPLHDEFAGVHAVVGNNALELIQGECREPRLQRLLALPRDLDRIDDSRRGGACSSACVHLLLKLPAAGWRPFLILPKAGSIPVLPRSARRIHDSSLPRPPLPRLDPRAFCAESSLTPLA